MIHVLHHLLSLRRPWGSIEEGSVIPYLIKQLDAPTWVDAAGNLHCDMRTKPSRTLFVGHVDTVHDRGGRNTYRTDAKGNLHASGGEPLGADDAAGVAIMCEMIAKGVPGYYIFTRGEEVGGVGSDHIAQYMPDLLEQFDRAVSFDRRGTTDIIYWQRGARSCSDAFAEALSTALNDLGLLYMPAKGVYTDTAEFTDLIPECTNISAGYYHEHSDTEWLDMGHWRDLRAAVLVLDWESLPTRRKVWLDDPLPHAQSKQQADERDLQRALQNMTDDGAPPFDPFTDDDLVF